MRCFPNPPTNFLNAIDIANKCKSGVLYLSDRTRSPPVITKSAEPSGPNQELYKTTEPAPPVSPSKVELLLLAGALRPLRQGAKLGCVQALGFMAVLKRLSERVLDNAA